MEAPAQPSDQLQWLFDRTAMFDLQVEFTRCLDTKEFARLAELFTDDGYIDLPFERFGKAVIAETAARHLAGYGTLQHQISNPSISIEGDEAAMRCNFEAVHVKGEVGEMGGAEYAVVGGVYEVSARREGGKWKLVTVKDNFVWTCGELAHG